VRFIIVFITHSFHKVESVFVGEEGGYYPPNKLRTFTKLAGQLRPAARLLADAEAQTVTFGNPHPAIAQLKLFIK
jgi:hypothetical protein